MNFLKIFIDIFAPKKCYWCWNIGSFLCKKCLIDVNKFEDCCYICKQKSSNFIIHNYCLNNKIFFDRIFVLYHYKDKNIKKLVKDAKFYHNKDIFIDLWENLWELLIQNLDILDKNIVLIPTPMYFFKKLLRWYNQSEILVKSVAKYLKLDYHFKFVKKVKNTKPQSHLSKMQRIDNLKKCYKIDKNLLKKYKNKTIIIIDDVVSTWTTINEISKLLKQSWIKTVYWLCIASD